VKRTIYILWILLVVPRAACAYNVNSRDAQFTHEVVRYAQRFANEHDGYAPASLSDLEQDFGRPIDEAYPGITPTKRYAFLSQPLHLPPPHEGDLLIITRRPFRDTYLYKHWFRGVTQGLLEPGRFIIYRTGAGEFRASYVDESYVQNAFRASNRCCHRPIRSRCDGPSAT
jgi:hypothetical protein